MALAGIARADDELMRDDFPLSFPARLALHERRAADAEAAGDLARMAGELSHACIYRAFLAAGPDGCDRAVEVAAATGRRDIEALAVSRRAGAFAWRLELDKARAEGLRALELGGARPLDYAIRGTFILLGGVAIEHGRYDEADVFLRLALALCEAAGQPELTSFAHQYLARNATFLGDLTAARRHALAGLAAARSQSDLNGEIFSLWMLGDVEVGAGRHAEAIAAYEQGLAGAVRLESPIHRVLFHNLLAGVFIWSGRTAESRHHLELSRAEIDAGRVGRGWIPVLDNLHGHLLVAEGRDREAAETFDRVRAYASSGWAMGTTMVHRGRALRRLGELAAARTAFEEGIRGIEAARPHGNETVRTSFAARHSGVYRELVALLWQMEGPAASEEALAVAESGRARALLDGLQAAGVDTRSRPLSAAEIRALLPAGTILVEFVSTRELLLAFVVSADGVRQVALPGAGTEDELAARVEFFRQLVQEAGDKDALLPAGRRLYEDLLAPLAVRGASTLLIAPDGPLRELPFDALVPAGDHFLVEETILVSTPSASILARAEAPPGSARLLAIADPRAQTELDRLPSSMVEAREVAARASSALVLSGAGATERRLRESGLGDFDVLHFATHALIDDHAPLRSALVLTPGEGDDGLWRASEIYALTLRAQLVVLSACRSAIGRGAGGEGLLSLERAFLFAGARTVVATLWEVGDDSSLALMRTFYGELAAGSTASAALATAKRNLIARGGPPRTWAGFVLTGAPDARVPLPTRRDVPWSPLALAALASLGAFRWWRARRSPSLRLTP